MLITRKKIKRIILRLDRFGNLVVSAPFWAKKSDICAFVEEKSEWIERRRKEILDSLPRYENGARFVLFDESYALKITQIPPKSRAKVEQRGEVLEVFVEDSQNLAKIEKLLFKWCENAAASEVSRIIEKYKSVINREPSCVKWRQMHTRWGSCNVKSAKITLSAMLFKKPRICLEFVLLHELAHLLVANHGAEFHTIMRVAMPNYREIARLLNQK